MNSKLQQLVSRAQQLAASGDATAMAELTSLSSGISKLAAVSQDDVASAVTALSAKLADSFAADPNYDPAQDLADLSDVSLHQWDGPHVVIAT